MSDENTTTENTAPAADEAATEDVAETATWTPPEGHTTLLDEAIRNTAASPMVWDESLPADGIVERNAPGEFVDSLQYSTEAPAEESTPEPAPAKKAPAKKAPAKKAPAKAAGAKAAQ